jgi:type IV secretory pathway VirB4 component
MMHRISRRLDGRPLLVPIDEGWQVAQDPTWQKLLFEKARTIRSRGGVLIFITQSPADAARQGVAEALVEQFPTQIHFANRRAQMADYVNGLKRTPREYEIIAELRENEGMALISHEGGSSRVIQLMMKGLDDERAILSIPEHLLRILESVRASVGDDPATLLAEFHRRRKEAASA